MCDQAPSLLRSLDGSAAADVCRVEHLPPPGLRVRSQGEQETQGVHWRREPACTGQVQRAEMQPGTQALSTLVKRRNIRNNIFKSLGFFNLKHN